MICVGKACNASHTSTLRATNFNVLSFSSFHGHRVAAGSFCASRLSSLCQIYCYCRFSILLLMTSGPSHNTPSLWWCPQVKLGNPFLRHYLISSSTSRTLEPVMYVSSSLLQYNYYYGKACIQPKISFNWSALSMYLFTAAPISPHPSIISEQILQGRNNHSLLVSLICRQLCLIDWLCTAWKGIYELMGRVFEMDVRKFRNNQRILISWKSNLVVSRLFIVAISGFIYINLY